MPSLKATTVNLKRYLFSKVVVIILDGLSSQTNQEFVEISWCVDDLRFEKVLA